MSSFTRHGAIQWRFRIFLIYVLLTSSRSPGVVLIKAHGCFQVALGWYSGDNCSLYGHQEHYSPIMEAWNGR